jgi:YHS domain-containing protein
MVRRNYDRSTATTEGKAGADRGFRDHRRPFCRSAAWGGCRRHHGKDRGRPAHRGLALGGYDPVAFYTDGKPLPGSPEFELQYGGAVWRFCNFGNRAAFAERPDVYMPKFGGYDPVGVARGVEVAGRPDVWLISDGRLFLFYDSHRLETFAADPERFSSAAERKWPEILRTLSP